ncbi:MAG: hypothetical protein CM1200mP18_19060 [Gammaproteobacteria bacterium]|nr:MAG: hypothetical protein CM1200mP18_19060 [Gammaproteobacteria bacterium]
MHTDTQTPTWMTEEHQLYAESVRRFLASEYIPHVARWNDQGYVDPEFWHHAGEAGILGKLLFLKSMAAQAPGLPLTSSRRTNRHSRGISAGGL